MLGWFPGHMNKARRQIKAGGLRVNDAQVSDERATLSPTDLVDGAVKLSFGKKGGLGRACRNMLRGA